MRLHDRADHGLRVPLHLAASPEPRPQPAEALARAFSLSPTSLAKVIQGLAAHGFVATVPGRHGGVRLARDPEGLRLGEIVHALEPMALAPRFAGDATCPFDGGCGLAPALDAAWGAFLASLDQRSLADVARATRAPPAGAP